MEVISKVSGNLVQAQAEVEAAAEGKEAKVKLEFLSRDELVALVEVLKEWGNLSLEEQILTVNALAEELSAEKVSPLVTEVGGKYIYPHVTYLSKLSSFSPVLALPYSGQGFSTLDCLGIRHPAVLTYTLTIGELDGLFDSKEEDELAHLKAEDYSKAKTLAAMKAVKLQWRGKTDLEGTNYKVGQILPDKTMAYQIMYPDGRKVDGPTLNKDGFSFVVGKVPRITPEDITLIGDPVRATRAQVNVKIWGLWCATSQAEKFAAMLVKLCVDRMPETPNLQSTMKGGVCLYPTTATSDLDDEIDAICNGTLAALPLTDVGSGQETNKGASTAEPCAALLYAWTGKRVLRPTIEHTQEVNGETQPCGMITWDTDEYVQVRNEWNVNSIHSCIWARWVDEYMIEIVKEACGYTTKGDASEYRFVPCMVGGYYMFHRSEVRVELAPLTMETSTQIENLGTKGSGSMFWEMINTISQL